MKAHGKRRLPPDKLAEHVLGGEVALRGFYSRIPAPEKITCSRCGEERNSIGQTDGVCLKCRWATKAEMNDADMPRDVCRNRHGISAREDG